MDFVVPVFAVVVGAALLAPGILRYFRGKDNRQSGCGGCTGCHGATGKSVDEPRVVQLTRK